MSNRKQRRALDVRETVLGIVAAVVFLACILVVVVAQQTVGWGSLLAMLGGLAGLIVLLALYNRRYR